jgi:glycosyltransferase involved in cell wall biosynthesis
MTTQPRLIVIGPTPPPFHGVAVSTTLALKNRVLARSFDVVHLDTTDRRSIENLGRWDRENIVLALKAIVRLQRLIGPPDGTVYLALSENAGGFLRDSLFIWSARVRGYKVAAHIRNSLFRQFNASQTGLFRWWIRVTMQRLTGVAVLGENLRGLMEGFVDDARVAVVPNGTPDFIRPDCEFDESLVLYLSNLSRKKGADLAVRTALLIAEVDQRSHFVFAGGWESGEFEREVRALAAPLKGRIEFRGAVDGIEKATLMASASVLLFPVSWGEGHPRILLEALAAGLPAVTTDRGAIRETVTDGVSGFVLDDPEPPLLAQRALRLLRDDALRRKLANGARRAYVERFTQERADRELTGWLLSLG